VKGTDNHFSLEEWVDFARGQTEPEQRERMQAHLDRGCRSCAQIVELWRTVLDVARREKRFQLPQNDLRLALALFAAFPPERATGKKLLVGSLLDCSRPAVAGARRSDTASHSRFMFQREDLFLDLQFQIEAHSVSMIGQILDPTAAESKYRSTTVKLMRERDVVAQTTTNDFGEFRLEYRVQKNLLLVIELEEQSHLITPLPHASEIVVYGGGDA